MRLCKLGQLIKYMLEDDREPGTGKCHVVCLLCVRARWCVGVRGRGARNWWLAMHSLQVTEMPLRQRESPGIVTPFLAHGSSLCPLAMHDSAAGCARCRLRPLPCSISTPACKRWQVHQGTLVSAVVCLLMQL